MVEKGGAFAKRPVLLLAFLLGGLLGGVSIGHAMVTDDVGTAGRGRGQVDLSLEYTTDREAADDADPVMRRESGASLSVTFGLTERLDLIVEQPYQWRSAYFSTQLLTRDDGLADPAIDLKWHCLDWGGWGFALKPGFTPPLGNGDRGLGAGRTAYRLYFIATREGDPWTFHVNLGYHRNENIVKDREDLWHCSAAAERNLTRDLKLGLDVGIDRNPDPDRSVDPLFALTELSYDLSPRLSLTAGVKLGLSRAERDLGGLLTFSFKF